MDPADPLTMLALHFPDGSRAVVHDDATVTHPDEWFASLLRAMPMPPIYGDNPDPLLTYAQALANEFGGEVHDTRPPDEGEPGRVM